MSGDYLDLLVEEDHCKEDIFLRMGMGDEHCIIEQEYYCTLMSPENWLLSCIRSSVGLGSLMMVVFFYCFF